VLVNDRVRKISKWAGVPVGALLSCVLVLAHSSAAFTAQTNNQSNGFKVGTVSLNNPLSVPLFNNTNVPAGNSANDPVLEKGVPLTNSITVNYNGNLAANVKLYMTLGNDPGSVAQYVDVTVKESGSSLWTGTLSQLATKNNFATGIGTWQPASAASKSYTITMTLSSGTPLSANSSTISASTFTWQAQTP